ncbi:hypothetical protein ACTA71_000878 [Dictyostelium dimigraforme]
MEIIDMFRGRDHYLEKIRDNIKNNPTFTEGEDERIIKVISGFGTLLPDFKIEKEIFKKCEEDPKKSTIIFQNILDSINPSFYQKVSNKLKNMFFHTCLFILGALFGILVFHIFLNFQK